MDSFISFGLPSLIMPSQSRKTGSNSVIGASLDVLKQMLDANKEEIMSHFSTKIDEIKENVNALIFRIGEIENVISSLKTTQNEQQHEINSLKSRINSLMSPETLLNEIEQRQQRSNNLIVSGLPEMKSGSIDDKRRHDVASMDSISRFLGVRDAGISFCSRIGKPGKNYSRFLKVSMISKEKKWEILRKCKALRNSEFKDVFIKPDLTPYQQNIDKHQQSELRRLKEEGQDVVIHRGRIQPRSTLENFRQ